MNKSRPFHGRVENEYLETLLFEFVGSGRGDGGCNDGGGCGGSGGYGNPDERTARTRCPGQLSRRQDGDHVGRNGDRGGEDGGHGRGGSPAKMLNIQI